MLDGLINAKDLVSSVVFSIFGLVLFGLAFFIFDKLTPGELGQGDPGKTEHGGRDRGGGAHYRHFDHCRNVHTRMKRRQFLNGLLHCFCQYS